jgi:DNA-binding LacI/PurR family transcriptional regulator
MNNADKPVRTIADIAQLAGVSKSTVSRALSDSSLISRETKDRIQAIARQYNFQIHQTARNLSLRRSHTLAFVVPFDMETGYFVTDPFHLEILGAITGAAAEHNYDLLIASIDVDDPEWPYRYLDAGRVDGLILLTCTGDAGHIQSMIEKQAPFIIWGVPLAGATHCSVNADDVTGGRLATQHLIEAGRKRIGFIGGAPNQRDVQLRYQGYETALQNAGYTVEASLVTYGNYTSRSGAEAMARLLEQSPELDAVFICSDLMAIAAMGTLQANGCHIPEDVAVVGYDDISLAAHSGPPLTTIRQNIKEAGKMLVYHLIQYLDTGVVSNVTLPVELIVRKSSGGE